MKTKQTKTEEHGFYIVCKPHVSEKKRLKMIEDILRTGLVKEVVTKIIINIKGNKKQHGDKRGSKRSKTAA